LKGITMNVKTLIQTLRQTLQLKIEKLENDKADYYADNHNQTDSHIMWLQGQIDGIKYAIKMIEEA
jgi:hypothetical protein